MPLFYLMNAVSTKDESNTVQQFPATGQPPITVRLAALQNKDPVDDQPVLEGKPDVKSELTAEITMS